MRINLPILEDFIKQSERRIEQWVTSNFVKKERTFIVPQDGNFYDAIEYANEIGGNATIIILGGEYYVDDFPSSPRLEVSKVHIFGMGQPVFHGPTSSKVWLIVSENVTDIVVQNIIFKYDLVSRIILMLTGGNKRIVFTNNYIEKDLNINGALVLSGSTDNFNYQILVTHNRFYDFGSYPAIIMSNVSQVTISDNIFEFRVAPFRTIGGQNIYGLKFINNSILNSPNIELYKVYRSVIANNILYAYYNGPGIYVNQSQDVTISNNVIFDNQFADSYPDVYFWVSSNIVFTNNIIRQTLATKPDYIIKLTEPNSVIISNNYLQGYNNKAIYIESPRGDVIISNNLEIQ